MGFTYCTVDDLKRIAIGQELKMNARYEDLKRENGQEFGYVARKDDILIVQRKTETSLIVRFFEDEVSLNTRERESYGEFLVEPKHIQKF